MKYLYAIMISSAIAAFYYTPKPAEGETNLHYIFSDTDETWQSNLSVFIFACCLTFLIMRRLFKAND